MLDGNPLDFVECDVITGSVVKFRRAGRFVGGDRLCILDRPAVLQVRRNAGGAKRVATRRGGESGCACPPLNHGQNLSPAKRVGGEPTLLIHGAKEKPLLVSGDTGRFDVVGHIVTSVVMGRDLVALAAFLV